jgi:hypothetical protein
MAFDISPDYFMGMWHYQRCMTGGYKASGTVSFSSHGNSAGTLVYEENGVLQTPHGDALNAWQRYLFQPEKRQLSILFDEQPSRHFHVMSLRIKQGALRGRGVHLCGDDRYDSGYTFYPDARFYTTHRVHGPRKRYISKTVYTRA